MKIADAIVGLTALAFLTAITARRWWNSKPPEAPETDEAFRRRAGTNDFDGWP
jgi:hypothetical protein